MTMTGDFTFKDDGYIELVLRMLGLMCDNQHSDIQVKTKGLRINMSCLLVNLQTADKLRNTSCMFDLMLILRLRVKYVNLKPRYLYFLYVKPIS